MLILSPDVYWRIPSADWRAHLELCNKNPDTLKGPDAMLNQSRDPTQVRTSAHLSKLYSQNSGELRPPTEIFLSLQTNYYELLQSVYLNEL